MRISRVLQVPALVDVTPSTIYIVKAPANPFAEIYLSTNTGDAIHRLPTRQDIDDFITDRLTAFNNIEVVADIAARDALQAGSVVLALVLDASADPTVQSGSAMYLFAPNTVTWHKVSEFESLDLQFTWDSLSGKPQSSPEDIDDAVEKAHEHSNKTVLDELSDNSGQLHYKNQPIASGSGELIASDW